MTSRGFVGPLIVLLLLPGAGCERGERPATESSVLESRLTRLNESLARQEPGDANKPLARWLLPKELAEISGLALTPDGRLFAHEDETARITEIDYRRGTVVKQFIVGQQGLRGDFEGLTYAHDRFYMLSSNGTIYQFSEGEDKKRVDYVVIDTDLGKECEFEGIVYDPSTRAIVLACKNVGSRNSDGMLVLYRYSLDDDKSLSQLTVPYAEVIGENRWTQVRPTDITLDPSDGNYVLVAAQDKALVELTPAGQVVSSRPLEGRHTQPEGMAITRDEILIIADESTNTAATITLYRWH